MRGPESDKSSGIPNPQVLTVNYPSPKDATCHLGIIGCGARIRGLLALEKQIHVIAVSDPHPSSILAARESYGPDLKVYDDYRDLVADPDLDWVAVGSWNCFHREHAVAALQAGKNVFCEKPLATSFEDCVAIQNAVRQTGKVFSFGLVLRYSPFYRKVHELLRSGRIGNLVSFEFNEHINFFHGTYIMGGWRRFRRNAGTHILEKCCHDLDIALWLTDSLPMRAASFGGLNFFRAENKHLTVFDDKGREIHSTWDGLDMVNPFTSEKDIVDNQVVILEFANGVRASFHANCSSGIPERRIVLIGTEGTIRADALTGVIELQRISQQFESHTIDVTGGHLGGHAGGDEVLLKALIASMRDNAPPLVGIDEGIKSALVCFAIDEAHDTGTVVDLKPMWERAGL